MGAVARNPMGKLISGVFSLLTGITLGTAGIALAAWVVLANYRETEALDWALWALEGLPFSLDLHPAHFANEMLEQDSLIWLGFIAAFLCWIGISKLRGPLDVEKLIDANRQEPRLVLKSPARVGHPVEGKLSLVKKPKPGEVFRVELSCAQYAREEMREYDGQWEREQQSRSVFVSAQERQAVPEGLAWGVPFRFEIPETAQASREEGIEVDSIYRWHLLLTPAKTGWWLHPQWVFPLHVAPAAAGEQRAGQPTRSIAQRELLGAIDALGVKMGRPLREPERAWLLRTLSPNVLVGAGRIAAMLDKLTKGQILVVAVVVALFVISILVDLVVDLVKFVLALAAGLTA